MADIDVSLDMVSFMGEWTDWGMVCEYLEAASVSESGAGNCRALPAHGGQNGAMRHEQAWTCDGAYLSCWVELSTLAHHWVLADRDGKPRGRIEFNPNRATERVLMLASMFEPSHATRADVALDYPGYDVGGWLWSRPRCKSAYHVGKSGVESLYVGSRASERFVVVYDKGLELGRDDLQLMRCEARGRRHNVLADNLFDGLECHSKVISPELDLRVAGRLAVALHYPDILAGKDKDVRKRYAALVDAHTATLEPAPAEVYRDALPRLHDMLAACSAGEPIQRAAVYEGTE